ncbi:hypothetical protein MKX03_021763 [Papaver bracteatum]|nr:hypothetical protein MKX03_021763 [Papaver bracteatum]
MAGDGDDLRMKLLILETRAFPIVCHELNETPSSVSKEGQVALIHRITTISKSVELGKHYFPWCNEALDKIVDSDELLELAGYNSKLPEERVMKMKKFMKLRAMFKMAFKEDTISTSPSSTNITNYRTELCNKTRSYADWTEY